MTFAGFVLGSLIALLFGSVFHFWRGGGFNWLMFYLILSLVGFWAGHVFGVVTEFHFLKLGAVNLGAAILSTLVFLFLGHWLSMAGAEKKNPGRKNGKK
jgi:hypothetical protein